MLESFVCLFVHKVILPHCAPIYTACTHIVSNCKDGKLASYLSYKNIHSAVFTTEEGVTCVTQLSPLEVQFEDLFQPLPTDVCEKVSSI